MIKKRKQTREEISRKRKERYKLDPAFRKMVNEINRKSNSRRKEHISKYNKEYREKNSERLNEYNREWYSENKEYASVANKKYREENKDRLKELRKKNYDSEYTAEFSIAVRERNVNITEQILDGEACPSCPSRDNLVFHHPHKQTKKIAVSKAGGINTLIREMEKCIIMCQGCHTRLHNLERL